MGAVCPRCMLRAGLEEVASPADAHGLADYGAKALDPFSPLRQGHFGDFELLEEIDHGGMGIVYKARQRSLGRVVAVKMLLLGPLSTPEMVERFRREAAAAAALQHPNIVAIHEVGECEGQPFFSMDYVEGRSLARIIAERGARQTDFQQSAEWARAIAEGVEHAHRHGILHRDLKPANVLIDAESRPRVTDFGLARRLDEDSTLTLTGQALGSPNYMPPELAAGRHEAATPASDVYSMGAMLYELLTGRPPFLAQSVQDTLIQIREQPPVAPRLLNRSLPRDLETICLRCLEKDPARRYSSARELADDLGRFLDQMPIRARPVGPAGRVVRWCGRKPALAGMGAALVLVIAMGLLAVLSQWRRAETTARRETEQRRRAEQHLHALELERVEEVFHAGNAPNALALLAHLLRQNPEDRAVAERIANELTHRSWPLPAGVPLEHEDEVHGAELSADGERVVTASLDLTARIWNARTGEPVGAVMRHDRTGYDRGEFVEGLKPIMACFNHDGSRVVTGAVDHRARVWDGQTGEPITPWLTHGDWVLLVGGSGGHCVEGRNRVSLGCRDRRAGGPADAPREVGEFRGVQPGRKADLYRGR
jgi:eukaryotic-like serine/threonine-protein kinase